MTFRRHLALACLIFFAIGWIAAVLGPALPDLAQQTHGSLTAVGGIISALFAGALLAQAFSGPIHDRWGVRPLLAVGLICLMIGLLGVLFSHSVPLTLLCGVVTGLGHGTVDIGISLFVALSFENAGVAALNFTNIFFGLGAIAGPAAASASLRLWHSALPALWAGSAVVLVAFILVQLMPLPAAPARSANVTATATPRGMLRSPFLWLAGAIVALYVGLENGLGGWLAEFTHLAAAQTLATGALVAALFWFALTGGRVLGTIGGARMPATRLLAFSAIGATAGGVLFVFSAFQHALLIPATLLLGVSFGPVYPTMVVLTTAIFPHAPGRATSIVASLGSVGGIIVPWLQGWFLEQVNPWSSALCVALLIGVMGGGILTIAARERVSTPQVSESGASYQLADK